MKKGFLSILMTVCMVFMLMPMAVQAEVPEHKHCICGASHTENIGDHNAEVEKTFTAWNFNDSLPSVGGNYYLTTDVTLAYSYPNTEWKPADGTVLCLNGHTIKAERCSESILSVDAGVTFTLTDCEGSGSAGKMTIIGSGSNEGYGYAVNIGQNGSFIMYGGSLSGINAYYYGIVRTNGNFTMYSGNISKNYRNLGNTNSWNVSGVTVGENGTFIMNGGSISENSFASDGGGVYNNGSFIMNGGSIDKNESFAAAGLYGKGGGVFNDGSFTMNGGSITENKASCGADDDEFYGNGGGVYNNGTFKMNGGDIIRNTATRNGGGVYNYRNFSLSGPVTIMDNTVGTNDNNLFLCNDKMIKLESAITDETCIGVTVQTPPTFGNSLAVTNEWASDYSSYFASDNSNYETFYENNTIKLKQKVTEITSVDVTIALPTPKDALASRANISTTGVATTNPAIAWKKGSDDSEGIARYNTAYTAGVTLSPDTGYVFASAVIANIKSADGSTVGSGTVTPNGDGTITVSYTFAATRKANVTRISSLQYITGVANGTQRTAQALGLPETVTIGTEDENRAATVIWDLENLAEGTYDQTVLTEQIFKANGTVILPEEIGNDNDIDLTVSVQVTVSAAGVVGAPQAALAEGTYSANQSVALSSTTDGADIYFTSDGTTPSRTNGTIYTAPVSIEGAAGQEKATTIKAIAVKSGMQDSAVAAFTYTIQIPAQNYTITASVGENESISPEGTVAIAAGSSEELTIRGNGEFSRFIGVKVDGSLLDQSNYTAREGSTIVTLKASCLNALAEGNHTVEILWTDGSASTTFTITANTPDNDSNNNSDVSSGDIVTPGGSDSSNDNESSDVDSDDGDSDDDDSDDSNSNDNSSGESSQSNSEKSNIPVCYVIQRGDTLSKIALRNGISLQALLAMNPQIKNPNRIFCGQIITIGFTGTATGANNAQVKQDMNAVYDTVQKGDSLSRIAYRNKLPLKQLVQMNPEVAKQKYIYIGQKVRIK